MKLQTGRALQSGICLKIAPNIYGEPAVRKEALQALGEHYQVSLDNAKVGYLVAPKAAPLHWQPELTDNPLHAGTLTDRDHYFIFDGPTDQDLTRAKLLSSRVQNFQPPRGLPALLVRKAKSDLETLFWNYLRKLKKEPAGLLSLADNFIVLQPKDGQKRNLRKLPPPKPSLKRLLGWLRSGIAHWCGGR